MSETAPLVVGLDLSLARTGIAYADGAARVLRTADMRGMSRLAYIRSEVIDAAVNTHVELVVVEGYSYASNNRSHSLGELGGVVRLELWKSGTPFVEVAPSALKKYATGNGAANKAEVVSAAHTRLGYERFDDNEADALWLRAVGLDLLGVPVCDLPKAQRAVIDPLRKVQPELGPAETWAVDVPTGGYL